MPTILHACSLDDAIANAKLHLRCEIFILIVRCSRLAMHMHDLILLVCCVDSFIFQYISYKVKHNFKFYKTKPKMAGQQPESLMCIIKLHYICLSAYISDQLAMAVLDQRADQRQYHWLCKQSHLEHLQHQCTVR